MKIVKTVLFAMLFACRAGSSYAQMIADPTTWTYETKKKGAGKYNLTFHLVIKPGWHIWSLKPGGDGMQIPPSFKFTDNPAIQLTGKLREVGKPKVVTMEGIDGKLTLFSEKVDYVQSVTVKGRTKISGTHEYQVCNESTCLPPKTKDFTFTIE
jgi:hypothetical protein